MVLAFCTYTFLLFPGKFQVINSKNLLNMVIHSSPLQMYMFLQFEEEWRGKYHCAGRTDSIVKSE